MAALEAFKNGKSMKTACDAVGVDRNTVAGTAIEAELHLAAPEVSETLTWNERLVFPEVILMNDWLINRFVSKTLI